MAILAKPPNYHAVFVSNKDNVKPDVSNLKTLTQDYLPLMLDQDEAGYSQSLAAPYAQTLSKGDQQDTTLGNYTYRSQRNWNKGALSETALATTEQYRFGVADARYSGVVTLPPRVFAGGVLPAIATSNSVKFDWMRWNDSWFCISADRIFRSVLNESALSGGNVIGNWTSFVTDATLTNSKYALIFNGANDGYNVPMIYAFSSVYQPFRWRVDTGGNVGFSSYGFNTVAVQLAYDRVGIGNADKYVINSGITPANGSAVTQLITYDATVKPTGFARVGNTEYILSNYGIHAGAGYNNVALAWNEYSDSTMGAINAVWRNALYVAIQDKLLKWDGATTLTDVGLNVTRGMPSDVSKFVRKMIPTSDALYVLTGDENNKCGIFAMTGDNVWHCLYVSASSANQIYNIGIDTRPGTHSVSGLSIVGAFQPRLWWAEATTTYYMYVGQNRSGASTTSPALGTTIYRGFAASGYARGSHIGSEYAQVMKDLSGALVSLRDWSGATGDVAMSVEIDRSGIDVPLTLKSYSNTKREFVAPIAAWSKKTVTATPAYNQITLNSVAGIAVGDFLQVGRFSGQVKSIASNTITLCNALSDYPAINEVVEPARPSGYEFSYKLTLATSDATKSPEIERVTLIYGDQALNKQRYTLYVRVEDNMKDAKGAAMPIKTAVEMRKKLRAWTRRTQPFWLATPDGDVSLVRCMSASEARFQKRTQNQTAAAAPYSIATLVLQEV